MVEPVIESGGGLGSVPIEVSRPSWPDAIWSVGRITWEVGQPSSTVVEDLKRAYSEGWQNARPLAIRYTLRETTAGFTVTWTRGQGSAWIIKSPVFEATLNPSARGTTVSGDLRLPYDELVRDAVLLLVGVATLFLPVGPTLFLLCVAAAAAFYGVARFLGLPHDMENIVASLRSAYSAAEHA